MPAARKAGAMVRQTRYLEGKRVNHMPTGPEMKMESNKGGKRGNVRGLGKSENLHNKIRVGKHVITHQDPRNVPQKLKEDPARHADQVTPGLVADTQVDLRK